MKTRFLFLLTVPWLLCACGMTQQQKADLNAVSSSGVTPAIYDKMLHNDPLSVADIRTLVSARVNESVIIRYVRDNDTTYLLSATDVQSLKKAGASDSLIDYLLQTARYAPGYYPGYYPDISVGIGYDPFWYGGYHHHYHDW